MAADLSERIESLKREVNPPGGDVFPDATDDDWLGHLSDAFWECRWLGLFVGYVEADGEVTPVSGDTDLGRAEQQVIVLYAGYRIVLAEMRNVKAKFRAKAGAVEFETEQSSTLLKEVLTALKERIALALVALGDVGGTDTYVFDSVVERSYSTAMAQIWHVR